MVTLTSTRDAYTGDSGDNTINAGGGDDRLFGGAGNDSIRGEAGADNIRGEAGDDVLRGGDGNDRLVGNAGNDTLVGGAGNDRLAGMGGSNDVAVFSGQQSDYDVTHKRDDVYRVTATNNNGDGSDRIVGIETLRFSDGEATPDSMANPDETITGTADADGLNGGDGDDTIDASGGDDRVFGGAGNDTIQGGAGADNIRGEAGDDVLRGGDGNDRLVGNAGNDTLVGGAGNDRLAGMGGSNDVAVFSGQQSDYDVTHKHDDVYRVTATNNNGDGSDRVAGIEILRFSDGEVAPSNMVNPDDSITGTPDADTLNGRDGDDTIDASGGDDRLFGGAGTDTIRGGAGADNIRGEAGDDVLRGGDGNDRLVGNAGNDTLKGGASNDRLNGLGGNDVLEGGDGNDRVTGGAGNDTLRGGPGDDKVVIDAADTAVSGGAGFDTAVLADGAGVEIDLAANGFESAEGGTGDDVIDATGLDRDMRLDLGAGADTFSGGAGRQEVFAGAGDDTVHGGAGRDNIRGEGGNDVLRGGDGDDRLVGNGGNDVLEGGAGNDRLDGRAGDNDIAVFSGQQDDYDVTHKHDDVYRVTATNNNGDGSDRVAGIEILRFSDGDISPSNAAQSTPKVTGINDATVTEGGDLTFQVNLDQATPTDASLDWRLSGDTAALATTSGGTTIPADQDAATITVGTVDNETPNDARSVTLSLANGDGIDPNGQSATGTIQDDGDAGNVQLNVNFEDTSAFDGYRDLIRGELQDSWDNWVTNLTPPEDATVDLRVERGNNVDGILASAGARGYLSDVPDGAPQWSPRGKLAGVDSNDYDESQPDGVMTIKTPLSLFDYQEGVVDQTLEGRTTDDIGSLVGGKVDAETVFTHELGHIVGYLAADDGSHNFGKLQEGSTFSGPTAGDIPLADDAHPEGGLSVVDGDGDSRGDLDVVSDIDVAILNDIGLPVDESKLDQPIDRTRPEIPNEASGNDSYEQVVDIPGDADVGDTIGQIDINEPESDIMRIDESPFLDSIDIDPNGDVILDKPVDEAFRGYIWAGAEVINTAGLETDFGLRVNNTDDIVA